LQEGAIAGSHLKNLNSVWGFLPSAFAFATGIVPLAEWKKRPPGGSTESRFLLAATDTLQAMTPNGL